MSGMSGKLLMTLRRPSVLKLSRVPRPSKSSSSGSDRAGKVTIFPPVT